MDDKWATSSDTICFASYEAMKGQISPDQVDAVLPMHRQLARFYFISQLHWIIMPLFVSVPQ
jgi:hypothetical protein